MLKNILVTTIILSTTLVPQETTQVTKDVVANSCKELTVTAMDGYANVRSTAEVTMKTKNIVGVLVTGTKIKPLSKDRDWVKINLPITGFISQNQITDISCDRSRALLMETGLPTITRLVKQAIKNNFQAAETLVKIANSTDGFVSEFYGFEITRWAEKNPVFLISILKKEPSSIYQPFLYLLSFELGKSQKRKDFEKVLAKLPSNNPIIQYWVSIK